MNIIDKIIFIVYILGMLGVGFYFLKRNKSTDDYYVGGRSMGPWHIGLSVVATDVGGGFSIGLGGLGFLIGISGSWMLFTGLLGAWISGVFLIPKVYSIARQQKFQTFPQVLNFFYNKNVAVVAGFISAIGYIGFSSSALLAGAKLASSTFPDLSINTALLIMGILAVVYTSIGGLKAVIYTDTIQWALLMGGLIFIGIPISYFAVGGWETINSVLSPEMMSFTNISWQEIVRWIVTIIPIWFVGMTLYQRIYASRDEKTARKAWVIAGVFEWPFMAMMGTILGLLARVAFESGMFAQWGYLPNEAFDEEMGLPVLLNTVLPVGLLGIMMSAYFSAILSTADSCLMAASGNIKTDIIKGFSTKKISKRANLVLSQFITLIIGGSALLLATKLTNVLDLMLYSYAFMVSGLFVPVVATLITKKLNPTAAITSMIVGGSTTTILLILVNAKIIDYLWYQLDPNVFGISASFLSFVLLNKLLNNDR